PLHSPVWQSPRNPTRLGPGFLGGLPPPPRAGAPMTGELQCRCLQTHAGLIPPKRIANVELIPEGPHCGVPEVIATLRDGREVCLEPTAPWVKMIVTKILNSWDEQGTTLYVSSTHKAETA
uniref:Chemokine interleukin-8-like domain-containing protein n=1 Tax=Terrapene triunguis TaxID=2587831 RepID=A0A674IZS8_9SAUR